MPLAQIAQLLPGEEGSHIEVNNEAGIAYKLVTCPTGAQPSW